MRSCRYQWHQLDNEFDQHQIRVKASSLVNSLVILLKLYTFWMNLFSENSKL